MNKFIKHLWGSNKITIDERIVFQKVYNHAYETIALLSRMVDGGEKHSAQSISLTKKALEDLRWYE